MEELKTRQSSLLSAIDTSRARELETRYVDLLERRIAVLEGLFEERKPSVGFTQI